MAYYFNLINSLNILGPRMGDLKFLKRGNLNFRERGNLNFQERGNLGTSERGNFETHYYLGSLPAIHFWTDCIAYQGNILSGKAEQFVIQF